MATTPSAIALPLSNRSWASSTVNSGSAVVRDPRVSRVVFAQSTAVSAAVEHERRTNRRWAAGFLARAWERQDLIAPGSAERVGPLALGVIGGMFELVADWLHEQDPTRPDVEALVGHLTDFHDTLTRGLPATPPRRR